MEPILVYLNTSYFCNVVLSVSVVHRYGSVQPVVTLLLGATCMVVRSGDKVAI